MPQEALAAIKRTLHAVPSVRDALVTGLAAAYATLPDDSPEASGVLTWDRLVHSCSCHPPVAWQPCVRVCAASPQLPCLPRFQLGVIIATAAPTLLQPSPYPHSHAASDLQVLYSILQRVGLPYSGQVLYRTAVILVEVMGEWRGLLVGEGAARALLSERAASPDVDVARVEGFALSILCHPDIHVRYASTALPVDTSSS